jgi:tRNA-dihydrouridine synthase
MIGRGALARPYLFRTLRGEPSGELHSLLSYCHVLRRYDQLMEQGGFSADGRLSRLKQWLSLARTFASDLLPLFDRVKRCHEIEQALAQFEHPLAA